MDQSQTWIKLYRSLLTCGFFNNPNLSHFWVWCLLKASHAEHEVCVNYSIVELKPGQFIYGRKVAAAETGLSEQNIRTCIKALKSTNNLTIQSTNLYSVVTICKWGVYQSSTNSPNQPSNHQANQQVTSNQPTGNQQVTTNKNVKNDKNDKNVKKTKLSSSFWDQGLFKNNEIKELFEAWIEVRKEKKIPNTERALMIAVKKLSGFTAEEAILSLNNAVEKGWRGIFRPDKDAVRESTVDDFIRQYEENTRGVK